jgi:hypothetical protein
VKNDILPEDIIASVKKEGEDLDFGVIRLEIHLRDGHPRWKISRSMSIIGNATKNRPVVKCLKTIN